MYISANRGVPTKAVLVSNHHHDHHLPVDLDCYNDRFGLRCVFFNIVPSAQLQIIWNAPMIAVRFVARSSTSYPQLSFDRVSLRLDFGLLLALYNDCRDMGFDVRLFNIVPSARLQRSFHSDCSSEYIPIIACSCWNGNLHHSSTPFSFLSPSL